MNAHVPPKKGTNGSATMKAKPVTCEELLARVPEIPHVASTMATMDPFSGYSGTRTGALTGGVSVRSRSGSASALTKLLDHT